MNGHGGIVQSRWTAKGGRDKGFALSASHGGGTWGSIGGKWDFRSWASPSSSAERCTGTAELTASLPQGWEVGGGVTHPRGRTGAPLPALL